MAPMKGLNAFVNLLQFSDGLFPAGGYAHSFGLETCVQSGQVKSAEDVGAFLHAYLAASAAPTDAVAVLRARGHAIAGDLDACLRLDQLLDALKPASELREASRQMGRQTLRVLRELSTNAFVSRFAAAVESQATPCHHPIVFGIAAAVSGLAASRNGERIPLLDKHDDRRSIAAPSSARPARWPAHPMERGSSDPRAGRKHRSRTAEEDMWSFTPEIEIAAMRHESLDARLFRS